MPLIPNAPIRSAAARQSSPGGLAGRAPSRLRTVAAALAELDAQLLSR